ncbi:MAG: hypothetical protein EXR74_08160 [Bdellovibrionales bacterium]|nr:hypothetical protein [Bdellovibrionales bacterium]
MTNIWIHLYDHVEIYVCVGVGLEIPLAFWGLSILRLKKKIMKERSLVPVGPQNLPVIIETSSSQGNLEKKQDAKERAA